MTRKRGRYAFLASIAFNEAKIYYEEKHDKAAFIKNIISDNTLLADLYIRAKELRFDVNAPRGVFLIRQTDKVDSSTIEVLQGLFPDRQKDFIFGVNERDVVLIKELSAAAADGREANREYPGREYSGRDLSSRDLSKIAAQIENTLTTELYIKPVIGVARLPGTSGSLPKDKRRRRLPSRSARCSTTTR
jgi:carbohydrate diacid regulator